MHGPAGGFLGAGNEYQVFGSFPGGPSSTVLMIVPPRYTQILANLYDIYESFRDVFNSRSIVLKAQEVNRMIRLITHLPYIADNLGSITRSQDLLHVTPNNGNEQHLYFPALPAGLNCSFFSIPAVGTVIPISTLTGIGEAINVNFYGEAESACED